MSEYQYWSQVQSLVDQKNRDSYTQAAKLLIDLRDAAAMSNQSPAFSDRLKQLLDQHRTKSAFRDTLRTRHLI